MQTTNWKTYQSLIRPRTHYINVVDSNWNVQVIEQFIAGTNYKNAHPSKKVYEIQVSDGYGAIKCDFFSVGLRESKEKAINMLREVYNQYNSIESLENRI